MSMRTGLMLYSYKDVWTKKDMGRFLKAYMEDIFKDAGKDGAVLPEDEKILRHVSKKLN